MPKRREETESSSSDSDDTNSSSGSQTTTRSGTSTSATRTTTGTGTGTGTTTTTSGGNKRVSFQKGRSGNRSTTSRTTTGTTTGTTTTGGTHTTTSQQSDSSSGSDSDTESGSNETVSSSTNSSQTITNGPNMRTTTASGSSSTSSDSDSDSDDSSTGSSSSSDSGESDTGSRTSAQTTTTATTTGTGTTRTSATGTTKTATSRTSSTSRTTTSTTNTNTTTSNTVKSGTSTGTTTTQSTNKSKSSTTTTGTTGTGVSGTGTHTTTSSSSSKRGNTATITTDRNHDETETASTTSTSTLRSGSTTTAASDRTGTSTSRGVPHTPRSASTSLREGSSSQATTARELKIPKIIIPDPPKREDLKNGSITSQARSQASPSTPLLDTKGVAPTLSNVQTPITTGDGDAVDVAKTGDAPVDITKDPPSGNQSKSDSKEGSRYDGADDTTSESSTIHTVDGSTENSPSRMPISTLQSRVVRQEVGIAAATNVMRMDKLPLAYMVRYRSPLDFVYGVLSGVIASQETHEKDFPEAEKTPSGSLSATNARSALRSFGVDEVTIRTECGDVAHAHLAVNQVQGIIERSLLKRIPSLFLQKFKSIDEYLSGEVSLLECNRILINSKIGASNIGEHNKVSVKLALFRRSLGVSVQQYSDSAEFFDLAPQANFRIAVNTGNNDVIINDVFTISNLVTAEKDQLVQALHACGHIRGLVDAFTLVEDQQVCYEPLVTNLMCHPRGWTESAAVNSELKSLFRERLVPSLVNPNQVLEAASSLGAREPHQDPFLLSTLKTPARRQSLYFPTIQKSEGVIERPSTDTSKLFATIKFSEVRLPNEKIPTNSPFYLLVSLVTEQKEIVTAARIYAAPQKKPSDIWTFPKGEDTVSVFGAPSDVVCVEICYSSAANKEASWENASVETCRRRGNESSAGFSSARLDSIEHGANSMIVSGGTIYERTIKRGADEKEKTGLFCCSTTLSAMRILTENTIGRPKNFPEQESLPPRFVIENSNLELLALCREAIYHRAEKSKVHGTPHVLHLMRDHVIAQSLEVVEDSDTMAALAALWKNMYKKFQKDQKADMVFVYQQLLLLMTKISAAKNCVVNAEEIQKLVKGESHILLQSNTPLKPIHL